VKVAQTRDGRCLEALCAESCGDNRVGAEIDSAFQMHFECIRRSLANVVCPFAVDGRDPVHKVIAAGSR